MAITYKIQAQGPAVAQTQSWAYINNKVLTSNLATLTTAVAHGITQVGTLITVSGVDSTFDGTYAIHSIPANNQITYVKTATNVATAAVSPVGVVNFFPVTSGFLVTNKVVQNYYATLTTSVAHGFSIGDYVAVTIGDTVFDTVQAQIVGTPSTTTFMYLVTTATVASTAVTQGAVAKTTYSTTYTVPALTSGISSSLYIANMTTSNQYYRIAGQKGGAALANQWLAFDTIIPANTTQVFTTGVSLNAAEVLYMQASDNRVIFTLDGSELA